MDQATAYARAVVAGEVRAGRLVRKACARHLGDLETSAARGLHWHGEHADRMIGVFSVFRQSKGRWAGERLMLLPWQAFVIGSLFGWLRADGTRRFKRARAEVGRKNGKSVWCGGLAPILAFMDGEAGAEVYIAATKRDQAKITWNESVSMVAKAPLELRKRVRHFRSSDRLVDEETGSVLLPLGQDTDGGGSHGLNPHGVVIDEEHAWKWHMEGFYEALTTGSGARSQPLFVTITTAGMPGTMWAEHRQHDLDVLEGRVDDDATFAYIATPDDPERWRDESTWIEGNPSIGEILTMDELRDAYRAANGSPAKERAFMRLRLNIPGQGADRWISDELWDGQPVARALADREGEPCWVGVYAASAHELAAICLLFEREGGENEEPGYDAYWQHFLPESEVRERDDPPYGAWVAGEWLTATGGKTTDHAAIRREIVEISEMYEVRSVGLHMVGLAEMASMLEAELGEERVVKIAPNMARLSEPTRKVGALLEERRLGHDANPVAKWAVGFTTVRIDAEERMRIDTSDLQEGQSVAPLAALVCAMHETQAPGDGGPSIYETRGLLTT